MPGNGDEGVAVVLPRTVSREPSRGDLFTGVERSKMTSPTDRPSYGRPGFSSSFRRIPRALRFRRAVAARRTLRLGNFVSSLLSPFGSRGRECTLRSGAVGVDKRDVGQERVGGLDPGDLVRRPFPLPRASKRSSSSSLDDDESSAGRFDEGRGLFIPAARSSMGQEAAGRAAAFPPATVPSTIFDFPMTDVAVESSVSVGFVEGEKVRVSPAHEAA